MPALWFGLHAALVDELVGACTATPRSEVPLSALVLGVKCGGSDGLSGLTANPLVGRIADWLTAERLRQSDERYLRLYRQYVLKEEGSA